MRRMYSENQLQEITKEVIESGQVDNAKPIYCHPCVMSADGIRIAFFIFNNIATPYATFGQTMTYLRTILNEDLTTVRVITTGGFIDNTKLAVAAQINLTADSCVIYGISESNASASKDLSSLFSTSIFDGVNKIN